MIISRSGTDLFSDTRLVPNAIVRGKADKRNYVGDQLDECTDFSSLYYRLPFEKVKRLCDDLKAEYNLVLIHSVGSFDQLGNRTLDMG